MAEIKTIFCNTCRHETNHEVKSSHVRSYQDVSEDSYGSKSLDFFEEYEYSFLICRGCDTAVLEEKYTNTAMKNLVGEFLYATEYSPKLKRSGFREIKRFLHIDKKLNEAYKEIIISNQQGLRIVTAMGIRALLEGICVHEGIDDKKTRGLRDKIKSLKSIRDIPSSIIDGLNSIKFFGDGAAHRLNEANEDSLRLSIDLMEALLTELYEAKFDLQHKAELLNKAQNK